MSHTIMSLKYATGLTTKAKAPTVTAILPVDGPAAGGTPVTITGTNFKKSANPGFTIGGVACTAVVVVNATTVTAVTGAHIAAAALDVVCLNDNTGDGYSLTGTGAGLFTYT